MTQSKTTNIVLVHGGFVDGSGWESVYNILKDDDYNVAVVQNPTISLEVPAYARTDFIIARDGRIAAVYLFFDKLP